MSTQPLPNSCNGCLNTFTLQPEPDALQRTCPYCDSTVWPPERAQTQLLTSIGDFELIRPVDWSAQGTVFEASRDGSTFLLTLANRDPGEIGLYYSASRLRKQGNGDPYGNLDAPRHANVLRCDPITWVGEVAVATIEFLDGKTLYCWLDDIGSFSVNDAVTIVVALLEALTSIGDVNPANPAAMTDIYITSDGRIKQAAFAGPIFKLFKPSVEEQSRRQMTHLEERTRNRKVPRGHCQPPECMPMRFEQTADERQRSHIYRFGALLRELVCGQGVPMMSLGQDQIQKLELIPVHEINTQAPPQLSPIIDRMIAFQPADRYSNYADALSALKEAGLHRDRVEFGLPAPTEPSAVPAAAENAWPEADSQFDFRRMKWGMTPEEVRASELTRPTSSMPAFIQYESEFAGHTYWIMYQFAELDGQVQCFALTIQSAGNVMLKKAGAGEDMPELAGLGLMQGVEPDEIYSRLIDVVKAQYGEPSVVDGAVHDDPEYLRAVQDEATDDDFADCKGTFWECGDTNASVQITPAPMQSRMVMARIGSTKLTQQYFDAHSN